MAVIVLVGLARTGKDTAADYIAKKYSYTKYTFSSVLAEILTGQGIEPVKKNMIELGDRLRRESGMDAVAQLLDQKITQKDNILLVGPRSIEEIHYFNKKFTQLKIIKMIAAKEQRYQRKSKLDPREKKIFFERDKADLQTKGFSRVLDTAQFVLKNYSTKKKLYAQIDKLFKNIATQPK